MQLVLAAVAAACAAATLLVAGALESEPTSRPDVVSPACRSRTNARACSVALRYLAALDLDRAGEACVLLDRATLEAAGGMAGCTRTLLGAKGIRIRYSVLAVLRSPLGWTVSFSTAASGGRPLRQQMLVSRAGRIVAVVPEP